MYPRMISDALQEGRQDAADSFALALERERHHLEVFSRALELLEQRQAQLGVGLPDANPAIPAAGTTGAGTTLVADPGLGQGAEAHATPIAPTPMPAPTASPAASPTHPAATAGSTPSTLQRLQRRTGCRNSSVSGNFRRGRGGPVSRFRVPAGVRVPARIRAGFGYLRRRHNGGGPGAVSGCQSGPAAGSGVRRPGRHLKHRGFGDLGGRGTRLQFYGAAGRVGGGPGRNDLYGQRGLSGFPGRAGCAAGGDSPRGPELEETRPRSWPSWWLYFQRGGKTYEEANALADEISKTGIYGCAPW